MKVMMLCGFLHQGAGKYFGRTDDNGGGWISGMINGLKNSSGIELYYAAFEKGEDNSVSKASSDGVEYSLVTYKDSSYACSYLRQTGCDVYHLFGAENPFVQDILAGIPFDKTLVYIQGLISEYYYHYKAGYDLYSPASPLFSKYIDLNANMFRERGKTEIEVFRQAKFIAGRTDWDHAFLLKHHLDAVYYHLDETLRAPFYTAETWSPECMEPHTIYVTQANYPIKAAHMVAEMLKILRQSYPDVRCLISGENLMKAQSPATKLGVSYASHIRKLIRRYGLENSMIYIGEQDTESVISHMQNANVFLSPSSIENSSNSLQEAMLIGTPCVSSYVGGLNTIVSSPDQCLMYPFDDPMLGAYQIARIFDDKELAVSLSEKGSRRIRYLADPEKNAKQLTGIYRDMYSRIQHK
ncbi:MAG: glycosyltransferase [Solobacterium sp.]|nr:glycosyltransferase [Solobacterium sp.]